MRLIQAAVDLFTEQGYDATTVVEITERAGLTKATFFRHFPDKREVLFAGQRAHSALLAEEIAAVPDPMPPLEAVAAALAALTTSFTSEQHAFGPRLPAAIAAHGELQERAAFKRAGIAATMAAALRRRGVADPVASVAAELGVEACYRAYDRWTDGRDDRTLPALTRDALDELRAAITTLA